MSAGAVMLGALAAGLIAWAAIATVALLGERSLRTRPIRLFGAGALGLLALDVAGVPIHWALPPSLLVVGLVAGLVPEAQEERG